MIFEKNYGEFPREFSDYDKSKVVIIPVPYDETSTWGKGADNGPRAIIDASPNMEFYDIETDSVVFGKIGIHTDKAVDEKKSPELMVEAVRKRVKGHIERKKFTVVIGGEHSVSIGAIKAHAEKYTGMCVLQLDAHSDMRDEYEDSKYNHACVMARAKEFCEVFQVGIRSSAVEEKPNIKRENIFYAHEIVKDKEWIKKVVAKLPEQVYVTIDLDVFDSSIMPSTGTPEPGGLFWYDVTGLLKEVAAQKKVVGFDVVELCPNKANKAPDFLASKLIYVFLSNIFK